MESLQQPTASAGQKALSKDPTSTTRKASTSSPPRISRDIPLSERQSQVLARRGSARRSGTPKLLNQADATCNDQSYTSICSTTAQ